MYQMVGRPGNPEQHVTLDTPDAHNEHQHAVVPQLLSWNCCILCAPAIRDHQHRLAHTWPGPLWDRHDIVMDAQQGTANGGRATNERRVVDGFKEGRTGGVRVQREHRAGSAAVDNEAYLCDVPVDVELEGAGADKVPQPQKVLLANACRGSQRKHQVQGLRLAACKAGRKQKPFSQRLI